MRDFTYQITERIATISVSRDGSKTLELNMVSYNGREPKIDLRRWERGAGREKMLKGITLDSDEAIGLGKALTSLGANLF